MKSAVKTVMKRVRDLLPDPSNPRRGLKDIPRLAESIRTIGLQVPLRISRNDKGEFQVIDGSRRLAALKQLGMDDEFIPCVLSDGEESLTPFMSKFPPDTRDALARLAQHGGARKGWGAYETALLYRDLLEDGVSVDALATVSAKWPLLIERGQKALGDLETFHRDATKFSFFCTGRAHGLPSKTINLLLNSGHLKGSGQVRWLPVILTKFKQPWKSTRTLLQLYHDALRGTNE